ncbi:MAG: alpha-L-fucosidase [Fidelibacterota bacterium]|nr:MAG: alpha-L-fucosidase [Candidatus Neomarinimicrobiota bacterium]
MRNPTSGQQYLLIIPLLAIGCASRMDDISPTAVVPTPQQIAYQEMELIGFIHFSVNTFTDQEWGNGAESPDTFNPTALDARQWAEVARDVGMKQLIVTAKHHDGFCLWPSAHTEHSVKYSSWKNGQGDVVGELATACREYGLKLGLYLSPWDRNHAEYGRAGYLTYYRNQLEELLTQYGEIAEIWFDGANGGSGYYGGANETRLIDRETYYEWPETWAMVKRLQPDILIFSDAGPDIRWIGNERGRAGETNWSTINRSGIVVGAADPAYLNSGNPDGSDWVVGECDVSIRPGWFYHARQDSRVKTPQALLDIYYQSVGRNGTLLLNIPPTEEGLLHETDIQSLREFRSILDETFRTNLASGKRATASNSRANHRKFSPRNLLDDDTDTYWATDDGTKTATVEIDLGDTTEFDRIMLQEPIRFGQRIARFTVEAQQAGQWVEIAKGTTIGYKRLLRIQPVKTDMVRIIILDALDLPALASFGLYKASSRE